MQKSFERRLFGLAGAAALVACGGEPTEDRVRRARSELAAPLPQAFCDIIVDGVGTVPAETDYLPNVVTCENGGAGIEALKAQAIAARSVAYWTMGTDGSICDSQGCQVYSCGRAPSAEAIRAVEETSGLYLSYDSLVTFGFYVDGDHGTAPPTCRGSASSGNPGASREQWITYNEGQTGASVQMSPLGFIPMNQAIFGQNRGCMSQWGARCLENDLGYDVDGILRFYYGDDIEVTQATGPCINTNERAPDGELESVDCSFIEGWSQDPDTPTTAVDVLVYVDEQPGDPAAAPTVVDVADLTRSDLCAALGSCDHGFLIPTPARVFDGNEHTVHVFVSDTEGGADRELGGSPRTVTCNARPDAGSGGAMSDAGPGPSGGSGGGATNSGGAAGASGQGPGSETRVVGQGGCSVTSGSRRTGAGFGLVAALAILGYRRKRARSI